MTAQKLLVVDDEIDVALSFRLILEKHGFSVDLFHKPLAALVSFKPGIYNLALLDVKMDEINGFDLYKKLIATSKFAS